MDEDPIISSALDVYSDESTVDNVENEILKIKSDNPKVAKILNNSAPVYPELPITAILTFKPL